MAGAVLDLAGGRTIAGTAFCAGTLQIDAIGELPLSLLNGAASTETASFLARTGLLDLQKPATFADTIKGSPAAPTESTC
jgi:hypothetical protein